MFISGKEINDDSTAVRLIIHILGMTESERENLLTRLGGEVRRKRKHERKPYFRKIDFIFNNNHYKGLIHDISAGGIFLETEDNFSVGQILLLNIPFSDDQKTVQIPGEIVRVTPVGVGVEFHRDET